ncbi:unnamed protein product [Soboliphyme baturini]|uniref:Uncharacterized protein n=1 Tax=Soboliphyme baturini TaxID=241478 RepID=A0A183J3R4_9BILA|nr:unnamed protein product [Soboliphyme baturini]
MVTENDEHVLIYPFIDDNSSSTHNNSTRAHIIHQRRFKRDDLGEEVNFAVEEHTVCLHELYPNSLDLSWPPQNSSPFSHVATLPTEVPDHIRKADNICHRDDGPEKGDGT